GLTRDLWGASQRTLEKGQNMDWKRLLTSFEGRINRGKFWAGVAVLIVAQTLLYMIVGTVFGLSYLDGGVTQYALLSNPISVVVGLALFICLLAVYAKRWHDRDKSGWWSLILFIPFVGGIWVLVECGCLPGTEGPNRFGPDPLAGVS
ncbi:MAG: DUF805 domain-containing protein, partial [Pseudomonadota bacterium]|nr:DUF805 domain-containing protein [Pseudomonadota bacterium]